MKKAAGAKRAVKAKSSQKSARKKAAHRKVTRITSPRKRPSVNAEREINEEIRSRNLEPSGFASGRQSGDFQGISRAEQADSESVDELVEEGNIFEAGAVAGVEEADNADEREVHTHEVPEDDVPDEYLEKE